MNPTMTMSENGLHLLMQWEGCKLSSFWDENGWAIGYGHHGPEVTQYSKWTQNTCNQVLRVDVALLAAKLSTLILPGLAQGQFDAMVAFAYNIGLSAFASSTVRADINSRDFSSVTFEMSRWIHTGHNVDAGLVSRRQAEIALWNSAGKTENQTQTEGEKTWATSQV